MPPRYYWLSDDAWAVIEPRLPEARPGPKRLDDRMIISGIIHMLKCGTPWGRCPIYYGVATTVYKRWAIWGRRGNWSHIIDALSEEEWAAETARIDAAYIAYHNEIHSSSKARGLLPLGSRIAKPSLRQTNLARKRKRQ